MNDPNYLIINPLQIELLTGNLNKKRTTKRKMTELEERFYHKMEQLKNISLQNKRLRYMIQNINHRLILVDV